MGGCRRLRNASFLELRSAGGGAYPRELQAHLKPLLDALRRLRDHGLTAARVVITFHQRRVLSLTERQLRHDEMTPKAFVESSWMASVASPPTNFFGG
jgi:hypothetical protein